MYSKCKSTRSLADVMKLGNDGNEMPDEENDRKLGADTLKNASGRTIPLHSSILDSILRLVRATRGSCIAVTNRFNVDLVTLLNKISSMRSWCSNAAMMFSYSLSLSHILGWYHAILMGKGGQISSDVLVCVVREQVTWRSRCRGDANMIFRHRRHTCTSVSHHMGSSISSFSSWDVPMALQNWNISRRASSVSVSIVTGPMS